MDDAAPKVKCEMVIGTDDGPSSTPTALLLLSFQGPPTVAQFQSLLHELSQLSNNNDQPIEAMDFDIIFQVNDVVDRLVSWCTEASLGAPAVERFLAAAFPTSSKTSSKEGESDAPTASDDIATATSPSSSSSSPDLPLLLVVRQAMEKALAHVLTHRRPKLASNVFRCVAQYWQRLHEIERASQRCFPEVLARCRDGRSALPNTDDDEKLLLELQKKFQSWFDISSSDEMLCSSFLPEMMHMLLKFPNAEACVMEGLAAAASASLLRSEAVLGTDMVAVALGAMQTHPTHHGIIREGCGLLQQLAVHGAREDPQAIPVPVLLANIGVSIDFLVAAAERFPDDTAICGAVAQTFHAMFVFPHNLDALLVDHQGVVKTLCAIATRHLLVPRIVRDALAALGPVPKELDDLQRRHLALQLRVILTKTVDTETITTVLALLLALLRSSYDVQSPAADGVAQSQAEQQKQQQAGDAMKTFFMQSMIPQMIAVALDHFGDDDRVLKTVAETALREMMMYKHR